MVYMCIQYEVINIGSSLSVSVLVSLQVIHVHLIKFQYKMLPTSSLFNNCVRDIVYIHVCAHHCVIYTYIL